MQTRDERISEILTNAFNPITLDVHNDSGRHAGHASSPQTGQSHYAVTIVASCFEGKSLIERHRMVYGQLKDEISGGIHALSIKAYAPDETPF